MKPSDEAWPLLALEHWGTRGFGEACENATGVATDSPLSIIGRCALTTVFIGIDGRQASVLARFKIFAAGSCMRKGAILGAPSLEPCPVGLGHKARPGCHSFEGLGLALLRLEQTCVNQRVGGLTSSLFCSFGLNTADVGRSLQDTLGRTTEVSDKMLSRCIPDVTCVGGIDWGEDSDEETDPTAGALSVAGLDVLPGGGSQAALMLDAPEVVLGPDEGAWVPACFDEGLKGEHFLVQTNGLSQVRTVAGVCDAIVD